MGVFAVPPAPSSAPTWLFQGNANPCWEPLERVPAGWEGTVPLAAVAFVSTRRREAGEGPLAAPRFELALQEDTKPAQGNGGEEEVAFKGFRKAEPGLA